MPACSFALRAVFLAALATPLFALENGLARTPPMGWNSWNKFGCKVSDQLIRETADAMVSSGMQDAGYQYIIIDDCWQKSRDPQGNIVPDAANFPNGIRPVADYVHQKGLKFGIYSDAGTETCQHRPGGRGYEYQDARQYAAWGVDYLKYDWCSHSTQDSQSSYAIMSDALRVSGRPIVFSLCEWGSTRPWLWARDIGNSWRTTDDIVDHWSHPGKDDGLGVIEIIELQNGLESYAGPGHWNDPDMLEVGNGGMTDIEYRAHFSMWAILAAPLLSGNDLRSMNRDTKEILTNKEVIAVDQDPLGLQGRRVRSVGDGEVWSKQLSDGGRAVALLNRGPSPKTISVSWTDLGYPVSLSASVRDLWAHRDLGKKSSAYSVEVPSHGVALLKLLP